VLTDLKFTVERVECEPYSVVPNLTAFLRVEDRAEAVIHAMVLNCQVRIEPQRRRYTDDEAAGLVDLFGPRERWSATLRPFQWLQTVATVQGFTGFTHAELPLTCSYDFEVVASKYLHALEEAAQDGETPTPGRPPGTVPLLFLFSGTVFTRGFNGFGTERIPWDREAHYDMPVQVWRDLMRQHYPRSGWVRLEDETMNALMRFKGARGLTTLDATVALLLMRSGEELPS
jgi:hypothetical protein